jgi:hypothetical protein
MATIMELVSKTYSKALGSLVLDVLCSIIAQELCAHVPPAHGFTLPARILRGHPPTGRAQRV